MPQPLGSNSLGNNPPRNNAHASLLTPVSKITQVFAVGRPQPLSSQQTAYLMPCMTAEAIALYASVEKIAMAADFVLLPLTDMARENAKRDVPLIGLTKQWLLFATASNGDAWLVRKHLQGTEIGFLNHAQGQAAIAQPLSIDFEQWLQLAYLMHQLEMRMITPTKAEVYLAMNSLHPSLPQRFPYNING